MGLKHVSASQVKTFCRCKRAWHFEKVAGIKQPSTKAQRRGTAIHHAIETFLEKGLILDEVHVDPDTGRVVDSGGEQHETAKFVKEAKKYLPKGELGKDYVVEQKIELDAGVPWIGFVDLAIKKPLSVKDYKSTSDIRRYSKQPEDLLEDPQLSCYAKALLDSEKGSDSVDVSLVYLETRNKKKVNSKEVKATLTRDQAEQNWARDRAVVREMLEISLVDDSLQVEANPLACGDFGGCYYRNKCGFDEENANDERNVGIMSFLKQIQTSGEKETQPVADSVVPPDAPKEKIVQAKTQSAGFRLYIDCAPIKGESYELLEDWLSPLLEQVNELCEKKNVPSFWLLPYGEQKTVIATTVAGAKKPPVLVAMSGDPYARESLPMLIPAASLVVRGLK